MSLISISEASELTGKSIPTLYRHIKEGKLTTFDNKIDTTDLLHVYGGYKSSTDYLRENELLHRANIDLKQDKEKLYQINELLRRSNTDLMQDKEKLYRIIATQHKWSQESTPQIKSTDMLKPEQKTDHSLSQRLIRKLFSK